MHFKGPPYFYFYSLFHIFCSIFPKCEHFVQIPTHVYIYSVYKINYFRYFYFIFETNSNT
jgi:hypothetical protein